MITTKTFYPNAHPESTSVDGSVRRKNASGESWSTIVAGNGTSAVDNSSLSIYIVADAATDKWEELWRAILVFDTSEIEANSTIISSTLSVYVSNKSDTLGATPDINVYTITGTPTTSLTASDYQTFTSTACSNAIGYNNISTGSFIKFVLNSNGLAAVGKGDLTRFGLRNANYDAADSSPTWKSGSKSSLIGIASSDSGTEYRPKLTVTFTYATETSPGVDLSSLEAIRNLEMSCMSRFYIDESGNAVYENRNSRNA